MTDSGGPRDQPVIPARNVLVEKCCSPKDRASVGSSSQLFPAAVDAAVASCCALWKIHFLDVNHANIQLLIAF